MECIKKEFVRTDENGRKWWRVILTAMEVPEKLVLSGADVDNLDDDIRFESGSVLITPDGEFVACEDENFGTEPRGGIKSVTLDPSLPLYDLDGNPTTIDSAFPLYYDQLTTAEQLNGKIITFRTTESLTDGSQYHYTITPTPNWFGSYDTAIGEPVVTDQEGFDHNLVQYIEAPEDAGSSTGNVINAQLFVYGGYNPTGSVVTLHCNELGKLDKTWNEINNTFFGVAKAVYVDVSAAELGEKLLPIVAIWNNNPYVIMAKLGGNDWTYLRFATEDPDDYPALED